MGGNGCGEMTENGERLADICGLNDLVIWNTILKHKAIRKLKWDGYPQLGMSRTKQAMS